MSSEVQPDHRSAADVLAAHVSAADAAQQRQRRLMRWLGTLLLVVVVFELIFYPRTHAVRVSPQHSVDVVAVTQDAGVQQMFGARGAELGPALVVQYFSAARGVQAQNLERVEVFDWARPEAEARGLGAIVVWRIEPVATRFLPFQRGSATAFRRRADSTWSGL